MIQKYITKFDKRQFMEQPKIEVFHRVDRVASQILPHEHDHFEFFFLLSDSFDYVVQNKTYHMKQNDLLVIPPGVIHFPDMSMRGVLYDRIVLWINRDFFNEMVRLDPDLQKAVLSDEPRAYQARLSAASSQMLYNLLSVILEDTEKKPPSYQLNTIGLTCQLVALLNRTIASMENLVANSRVNELSTNILFYIQNHITEELSLEKLSDEFFVSKGYLSKIFKDHFGISVYQYILQNKIDGVCGLIADDVSITEAASRYGFRDYPSFYRSFKKVTGMSPKAFRSALRNPEKGALPYTGNVLPGDINKDEAEEQDHEQDQDAGP